MSTQATCKSWLRTGQRLGLHAEDTEPSSPARLPLAHHPLGGLGVDAISSDTKPLSPDPSPKHSTKPAAAEHRAQIRPGKGPHLLGAQFKG
jgi:hypothetical protein